MAVFSISGTNFGIDSAKSVARVNVRDNGSCVLTLDVTGDETLYREAADCEDSEWDWSLYPPRFYLIDYDLARPHRVVVVAADRAGAQAAERQALDRTVVGQLLVRLGGEGIGVASADQAPPPTERGVHLTAPAVSPLTICRCRKKKISAGGTQTAVAAAISRL